MKALLTSIERTVISAVASFLGSVAVFPGGAWDAKHLEAAGVAAAAAAAYQLSGVLNTYLATPSSPPSSSSSRTAVKL